MRADKFLADFVLNKDSGLNKKMESIKYYQKIFAIHQINKEEFQQSFAYYRSHPALFKMIMDSLTNISKDAPTEITKPSIGGDTLQKGSRLAPLSDTVIPLRKEKRVPLN